MLHCGNLPIPDRNNGLSITSKAAHSSSQRSFIGLTTLLLPVVSQDQEPGAPPPAPGSFLFRSFLQIISAVPAQFFGAAVRWLNAVSRSVPWEFFTGEDSP